MGGLVAVGTSACCRSHTLQHPAASCAKQGRSTASPALDSIRKPSRAASITKTFRTLGRAPRLLRRLPIAPVIR